MPTRAGSSYDVRAAASADLAGLPDQWLRCSPAPSTAVEAPLVVVIDDGGRLPRSSAAAGCAVAVLDTSAHAGDTVDALHARTISTINWLAEHSDLVHDVDRMVVVGRGTGALLAAMLAVDDPRLAGVVLVSGVYDHGDVIGTLRDRPGRGSLLSHIGASDAECVVAWACDDPAAVRLQGQAWAATWSVTEWNRPATVVEIPAGRGSHLVDDLFDGSTPLGHAVLRMLNRIRTT